MPCIQARNINFASAYAVGLVTDQHWKGCAVTTVTCSAILDQHFVEHVQTWHCTISCSNMCRPVAQYPHAPLVCSGTEESHLLLCCTFCRCCNSTQKSMNVTCGCNVCDQSQKCRRAPVMCGDWYHKPVPQVPHVSLSWTWSRAFDSRQEFTYVTYGYNMCRQLQK